MEELPLSTTDEKEFDEKLCVNCQENPYEAGHPVDLCTNCRSQLIKYPIPKWIKVFALCLIAIILIALIRTQTYISAAIDLGKGEKAMERKEFVTAQRELIKVLSKFPDDVTANANLIIAAAYNLDLNAMNISYQRILEKNVDDSELVEEVKKAIAYVDENFVQDTVFRKRIDSASKNALALTEIANLLEEKNGEPALKILTANYLFDLADYARVEQICLAVLKERPNSYNALALMSALKRNTGKYEEAVNYCDKILAVNKESVYAISQKARIELKRKRDDKAAGYAAMAMKIDPQNDASLEALAMVDYFAGRKAKSLESLSIINANAAISGDSTITKRLTPIINGTSNYR